MPYIARAMNEAQIKGIPTAAIVGSASLASARYANTVLSAQAHPSTGIGIVSIEAIVYALSQVLHWRFADRFTGTEQAISEISYHIREHIN